MAGLLAFASLLGAAAEGSSTRRTCTELERELGLCHETGDGYVQLEAWQTVPGSPASSGEPGFVGPRPPEIDGSTSGLPLYGCLMIVWRVDCIPRDAAAAAEDPITLQDIAAFRPTPAQQRMEPDGWTVAGLDTNFYAITQPHVVAGTLLGRPADVRFTPVAFHWAYGDGSNTTLGTKGGTWAALGTREFEPTPTSHVYEQLGDYTITLRVSFAAEYRFDGSSWRPIVGQLTLPANDLHIRVGTAKTVLVDEDCLANPSGPGC
jgi:hypothetical protein